MKSCFHFFNFFIVNHGIEKHGIHWKMIHVDSCSRCLFNTTERNCRPWGLGALCAVVYEIGGFKPLLKRLIH
jgi:hypothetical protein